MAARVARQYRADNDGTPINANQLAVRLKVTSDEAAQALAEARTAEPENPQAWLLSATLSRRQNNLAMAQTQIEKAANLAPNDPEVGLEAGVIAMLSGNKDAARRSWTSVTQAAPGSDAAATAKQYLDETAPEPTPDRAQAANAR